MEEEKKKEGWREAEGRHRARRKDAVKMLNLHVVGILGQRIRRQMNMESRQNIWKDEIQESLEANEDHKPRD